MAQTGRALTVADYFESRYRRLRFPHLCCLQVGDPAKVYALPVMRPGRRPLWELPIHQLCCVGGPGRVGGTVGRACQLAQLGVLVSWHSWACLSVGTVGRACQLARERVCQLSDGGVCLARQPVYLPMEVCKIVAQVPTPTILMSP
eukprot:COSAG01_NODE_724_length_14056_cov_41.795443_6_plen_146_part_00